MPTTPRGLPYPAPGEAPDGPYALQQLAEAAEAKDLGNAAASARRVEAGRTVVTTDATGNAFIAHNLGTVPIAVLLTTDINAAGWVVQVYRPGVTTTQIQIVVTDTANARVASTSVTVNWLVYGT